ncbi:MAG: hypothetical protein IJI44_00135 [Erysipelotrichaceae bacterium]|nr:hypothetical protein [Clostridia bacterium]MBQ6477752.1 hypothetical protein [Erysipelotrichaceae bacterium]
MMDINDFKRKGFLPFCMEEIRLAFSRGIDPKLIGQYMNDTAFDNLQLRQIRLGLEQDLDVSAYARTSMPYEEMEKIRERLLKEKSERDLAGEEEKHLEQQQIRTEVNRRKLHNTLSFLRIVLAIGLIGVVAGVFLFGREIYRIYNEDLYITFRKDEVILEYRESFVPEDQIKEHSEGSNIMIIYPSFTADELGDFTVTYQLSNGLKTIREDLKIRVIDSTPPVIRLKEEEIRLIRDSDEFVPKELIDEVSDNYDQDPDVTIGELDWNLDEQDIHYLVEDSSGNRSEAVLHVFVEDKPKEKPKLSGSTPASAPPSESSSSAPDSQNSVGGNTPQIEPAKVYCHNVTVKIGTDPGTAAYSTYDGLSGNITISIQYPELNTSSPGTYPVYYINQATGETMAVAYVTVTE